MGIEVRGMAPLLQVFDMPTSIAFYRDVLGFEVVTTSKPQGEHFDWALLRLKGVELMLNTSYEQDTRPPLPIRLALPRMTIRRFTSVARMWMRPTPTSVLAVLSRKNLRTRTMA